MTRFDIKEIGDKDLSILGIRFEATSGSFLTRPHYNRGNKWNRKTQEKTVWLIFHQNFEDTFFFGPVVPVCYQRGHLPVEIASVPMDEHQWKMKSQPMRKWQTDYDNALW